MKKHWIALIVGIVILVVAAIVLTAVPVMGMTWYEREPYTATEPYTRTETYYETEPYVESVPIEYRVTDSGIYNWFWHVGADCWVTIKNADIKSGYFYVTFHLVTKGGATATKSASQYIAIGEEKEVRIKHSGDYIENFTRSITAPTKEVTRYREVLRTREVTEYREVTRYRDVLRTKRATVLEYLMGWR